MKVIYKYPLPVAETATLALPLFAQVIRIDSLNGFMWLWALVDTEQPLVNYKFNAYKTGGEIPKDIPQHYVGCAAIFIQMELMLYWFQEVVQTLDEPVNAVPKQTLAQFIAQAENPIPVYDYVPGAAA